MDCPPTKKMAVVERWPLVGDSTVVDNRKERRYLVL